MKNCAPHLASSFKINRKVALKKVDAISICEEKYKSDEMLLHVKDDYDYRYLANNGLKNSIVLTVR